MRWEPQRGSTRCRCAMHSPLGWNPASIRPTFRTAQLNFVGRGSRGRSRCVSSTSLARPSELSLARYRAIPAGGSRRDLPHELMTPCWREHTSGAGDVMGRLRWDTPSVTIRTEFFKPEKGRYPHPEEHLGRSTHAEAACIQGFAEDFAVVRHEDVDRAANRQCGAAADGTGDRDSRGSGLASHSGSNSPVGGLGLTRLQTLQAGLQGEL